MRSYHFSFKRKEKYEIMAFNMLKRTAARGILKAEQLKARAMAGITQACTKENLEAANRKAQPIVTGVMAGVTAGSVALGACADQQLDAAKMLIKNVCNVIGAICIAAAVIFFIWGFVGIGISNASDGGGQEKEKAQKKIVGAIAVLIVGSALIALKGKLAGLMKAGTYDSQ